jgi:hypothetical protein
VSEYLIAHIGHTTKHHEHITWWKPDSCGYTICIDKAGRYSKAEAHSICSVGSCIAVLEQDADLWARSTPYYRRSDGTLNKLYDGGPHRPVPNSQEAWGHLLSLRLSGCAKPIKPTTIGARGRAIYIDKVIAEQPAGEGEK